MNQFDGTKIIAFHLPQYHVIPENNIWWGDGFTDWVNVKKARPLYKQHNQPRIPLGENYYDLSNVEVMRWQSEIAKKYGIYGFCYYHYWFENGKKLLFEPLENLLAEPSIDFPFCLCWANEPWARTWDGREKDVLIHQNYGKKEEWKQHFEYLINFFLDKRYIRVDDKPVIIIYRSGDCENYNEMIQYWRELCSQHGLSGLHVIDERNGKVHREYEQTDAVLDFEPLYSLVRERTITQKCIDRVRIEVLRLLRRNHLSYYSYDNVWKQILRRDYSNSKKKIYSGAFMDWDNTPRKTTNGIVIEGATPEKFSRYFKLQLERANSMENEFLFINAWNEWAEGTYLEPDEKYGYAYLEAIGKAINEV